MPSEGGSYTGRRPYILHWAYCARLTAQLPHRSCKVSSDIATTKRASVVSGLYNIGWKPSSESCTSDLCHHGCNTDMNGIIHLLLHPWKAAQEIGIPCHMWR